MEALGRLSVPQRADGDRILFQQGEPCCGLFILKSGDAVLEMRIDSGPPIVRFEVPGGSLLGLPAVVANQPYSLTATALLGSEVSFVNRTEAMNLLASNAALSLKALQVVAAETRAARLEMASLIDQRRKPSS